MDSRFSLDEPRVPTAAKGSASIKTDDAFTLLKCDRARSKVEPRGHMIEDCWCCEDPVLRPLQAPLTATAVCRGCYRYLVAGFKKEGLLRETRRIRVKI